MNPFTQPPKIRWAHVLIAATAMFAMASCVLHQPSPDGSHRLERSRLSSTFEFPNRVASWYNLHPGNVRNVASGRRVDPDARLAAHRELPFGTWLFIRNPENGRTLMVEVLDRGPYVVGRDLDLSQAAFAQLAPLEQGLLKYEVLEVWIPARTHSEHAPAVF